MSAMPSQKAKKRMIRTRVDQIASTFLQYPYRLRARAANLLDDKLDVLGVNTGLIHVAVLLNRLELGDVIVIGGLTVDAGTLEVGDAAGTTAAGELLGSRELRLRIHVLDLEKGIGHGSV